jgi:hypothetical protein
VEGKFREFTLLKIFTSKNFTLFVPKALSKLKEESGALRGKQFYEHKHS